MAEPPETPPAMASPRVTVDHHDDINHSESSIDTRPPFSSFSSVEQVPEGYRSPMRHHKRTPSTHREIKETLDARVEYGEDEVDGRTEHHINQYTIKEEIGRGSFGAVHIGVDQYGTEYAIKEFSKARLRRRVQSHILRQGPRGTPRNLLPRAGGAGENPRQGGARAGEDSDALFLIRQEIAIMKKLDHPNLVQLIEVLDDPEEDSLYMVMEVCKKGVVMNVEIDEAAKPYGMEACRYWFRDLILGIEYLHAQGVIHRDIKPDNLLISDDDVLKVVDFGVSEMFEKAEDMRTAKSAGSPAFLPPELCGKHGNVSGKAADIWSMGVTLFCLRYGKIPFHSHDGMMAMYEAIKSEAPHLADDEDANFRDLMTRILEKDPDKRIKMKDIREHPWVTQNGTDTLLSAEENCSHIVEPPNELELNRAFTRKMNHLLCIMKAIHRFKAILGTKHRAAAAAAADTNEGSTNPADDNFDPAKAKARALEIDAVAEISRRRKVFLEEDLKHGQQTPTSEGHDQEPLFLGIGTGARDDFAMDAATPGIVADSPTAADFNIYDRAYEQAVQEHLNAAKQDGQGHAKPKLYLTRFVKEKERFKKIGDVVDQSAAAMAPKILERFKSSGDSLHRGMEKSGEGLSKMAERLGLSDTKLGGTKEAS